MIKKGINIIFAANLLTISFFWAGCSKNTEPDVAKIDNVNQPLPVSNRNISANAPSVPPANISSNTPTTMVNNNSSAQIAANQKSLPAVKAPTPIIGSGGEDLLLFTQVRGALNADQALAYVIIDVKEGNVTLSGNVANDNLKVKAGNIAQNVKGVKSVKNNLHIS